MTTELTHLEPVRIFSPWGAIIAAAFVAAQAAMPDIVKDKKAKIEMKGGGSFGYSYADLGLLVGLVRPVLAANGLAQVQDVVSAGNQVMITTTLVHTSGESVAFGPLSFPAGAEPRATGSAITYARRYALLATLGLATEDDDGEAAGKQRPQSDPPTRFTDDSHYDPPPPLDPAARALFARVVATKGTDLADMLKTFAADNDRKLTAREFEADPAFAAQVTDILTAHEVAA